MKLCQKCKNEVAHIVFNSDWLGDHETTIVQESDCGFWAHKEMNNSPFNRTQVFHPQRKSSTYTRQDYIDDEECT